MAGNTHINIYFKDVLEDSEETNPTSSADEETPDSPSTYLTRDPTHSVTKNSSHSGGRPSFSHSDMPDHSGTSSVISFVDNFKESARLDTGGSGLGAGLKLGSVMRNLAPPAGELPDNTVVDVILVSKYEFSFHSHFRFHSHFHSHLHFHSYFRPHFRVDSHFCVFSLSLSVSLSLSFSLSLSSSLSLSLSLTLSHSHSLSLSLSLSLLISLSLHFHFHS